MFLNLFVFFMVVECVAIDVFRQFFIVNSSAISFIGLHVLLNIEGVQMCRPHKPVAYGRHLFRMEKFEGTIDVWMED